MQVKVGLGYSVSSAMQQSKVRFKAVRPSHGSSLNRNETRSKPRSTWRENKLLCKEGIIAFIMYWETIWSSFVGI